MNLRESLFFERWKSAILLNPHFLYCMFGEDLKTREDVEAAETIDDLKPRHDAFVRLLPKVSSTEAVYLVALYSFYDSTVTQDLCIRFDISCPTPGKLANYLRGTEQMAAIKQLIEHFHGW